MRDETNIIDINIDSLKSGYIRESELNSICYLTGRIQEHISENVDLIDMGETYIIANRKLNKSIEIVASDWNYSKSLNNKYVFGLKNTADAWGREFSLHGINCLVISDSDDSDDLVHTIINLDTLELEGDLKDKINGDRQVARYIEQLHDDTYIDKQLKLLGISAFIILGIILIINLIG